MDKFGQTVLYTGKFRRNQLEKMKTDELRMILRGLSIPVHSLKKIDMVEMILYEQSFDKIPQDNLPVPHVAMPQYDDNASEISSVNEHSFDHIDQLDGKEYTLKAREKIRNLKLFLFVLFFIQCIITSFYMFFFFFWSCLKLNNQLATGVKDHN